MVSEKGGDGSFNLKIVVKLQRRLFQDTPNGLISLEDEIRMFGIAIGNAQSCLGGDWIYHAGTKRLSRGTDRKLETRTAILEVDGCLAFLEKLPEIIKGSYRGERGLENPDLHFEPDGRVAWLRHDHGFWLDI